MTFIRAGLDGVAAAAAGSSDLVGRRVGDYQIQAQIGAGGMGEVYRAHDTRLRRDVAIKTLPRLFTGDADRLARSWQTDKSKSDCDRTVIRQAHNSTNIDVYRLTPRNPFGGQKSLGKLDRSPNPLGLNRYLSTHPPIDERVNRLPSPGLRLVLISCSTLSRRPLPNGARAAPLLEPEETRACSGWVMSSR